MEDAATDSRAPLDPVELPGALDVLRSVARANEPPPTRAQLRSAAALFLQRAANRAADDLQRDLLDAAAILHGLGAGAAELASGGPGGERVGLLVVRLSALQAGPE